METPTDPTTLSHRIEEGLARIAGVMRAESWNRAKRLGLTATQLSILELLDDRIGGLGVKGIAANLGVSQPTATDSIAALERKGLLTKRGAGADRRALVVAITPDGRAALAAAAAPRGAVEQAVDRLPVGEQQNLLLALVQIIRGLQQLDAIPIQRMCVTCRYFAPFAYADAAQPHHCHFVDAAFGQSSLRIDCRDHESADPADRAATWKAFEQGSAFPPGS